MYLRAFIAGSSWPAFVLFFQGFYSYQDQINPNHCFNQTVDPYYFYTIFTPVYMGMMSIVAIILHLYFGLSIDMAYLAVGIVSAILVSIFITVCRIYTFTPFRLFEQYIRLLIFHVFNFNIIIATIYKFLQFY